MEQINVKFANDAIMLEEFTEGTGSLSGNNFDCTQDPDDFARRLGIGTQGIKEIDAVVAKEMLVEESDKEQQLQDKENKSPEVTDNPQV